MTSSIAWTCLCSLLVANVAAQDPNAAIASPSVAPQTASAAVVAPVPTLPATVAIVPTTLAPAGITFGPSLVNHESEAASNFIDGFIGGYLKHVDLNPGEKTCLRENIRKMGSHAISMVKQVVTMVRGFLPGHPPIGAAGGVFGGMSAIGQVMSIVSEVQLLGDGCVESDTMSVLKVSLAHLKNVTYIQTRFVANGIDILKVVSDAAPQVHTGNYHGVGYDLGTVMRKLILSSNNVPIELVLIPPMTKEEVGPTIVEGVINGFFVFGTNLTVRLNGRNDVNIFVDLHRCIAKEAKYFTKALNAVYLLLAEVSTNIERWKLEGEGIQTQEPKYQMAWMTQLSGLMANLPILMNRCGLTTGQLEAMSTAIDHFDHLHLTLGLPGPVGDRVTAGVEASQRLEEATKFFEEGKYMMFGELMGSMLRDILLAAYPQLYSLDKSGKLQWKGKATEAVSHSLTMSVTIFAAVSLIGLSLVRVVHRVATPLLDNDDIEALGETEVAVE